MVPDRLLAPSVGRGRLARRLGGAVARAALALAMLAPAAGAAPRTIPLDAWTLRTSAGLAASPAQLSRPGYRGRGWRPAVVPGSVLASLARAGAYPNVTYGERLLAVPSAPFAVPWWYRTEVVVPRDGARSTVLALDGLNARGAVWVNGRRVAGEATLVGAFRRHRLDITRLVRPGRNAIAVRVQPVRPDADFTVTWVDWNPHPPDHGMGLWQPASLIRSGPVAIADVRIATAVALPRLDRADVRVELRLRNATARPVRATVRGTVAGVALRRVVRIGARRSVRVAFGPGTVPGLALAHPRLWWPHDLGEPALHDLALAAVDVAGAESDVAARRFGIRDVRSRLDARGHRVFSVNGRDVRIRAGGWAGDILLRQDGTGTARQVELARDAGLNALRLEGKLDGEALYAAADRVGVMLLPGWMCCDRFEQSGDFAPAEVRAAARQMADQAARLRDHPSVIGFLIGSDMPPVPAVAAVYRRALDGAGFAQPVIASATAVDPRLGADRRQDARAVRLGRARLLVVAAGARRRAGLRDRGRAGRVRAGARAAPPPS